MKLKIIISFALAFLLFCFVTRELDIYMGEKLAEVSTERLYLTFKDQSILNLTSPVILERYAQDPQAVLLFGSSELSSRKGSCYPLDRYAGTDKHIILAGAAGAQSLFHAVAWMGLPSSIKAKIIFMISPQWFNKNNSLDSGHLSVWLSSPNLAKVVMNESFSISENFFLFNRLFVTAKLNRKIEILPFYLFRLFPQSIRRVMVSPYGFYDKWQLWKLLKSKPAPFDEKAPVGKVVSLAQAIVGNRQEGKQSVTNNEFGIYDNYFDKHIKNVLKSYSGKYSKDLFHGSDEEEDFKFALKSLKQWKNSTAVIIPVHGKWYDYAAHPQMDRQEYYQAISKILVANEVKSLNLGKYEYEPYFFADIMHLGWVGWCFVDEAIEGL